MRAHINKGIIFRIRATGRGMVTNRSYRAVIFKDRSQTSTNYQYSDTTSYTRADGQVEALFTFTAAQTNSFTSGIDVSLEVYDFPNDATQRSTFEVREPFAHVHATTATVPQSNA